VLAEARDHGGRVLVTRESQQGEEGSGTGGSGGISAGAQPSARQVLDSFEPVGGPEAVQTPKQVGDMAGGVCVLGWVGSRLGGGVAVAMAVIVCVCYACGEAGHSSAAALRCAALRCAWFASGRKWRLGSRHRCL
jgi:hypothetical protein